MIGLLIEKMEIEFFVTDAEIATELRKVEELLLRKVA